MSRPPFVKHWTDVLGADDSRYPGSDELHSIGAPLARATGLSRIGVHHEVLPPGRRTSFPHAEKDEEELVYVLEGTPDAWIDGQTHPLRAGDAVGFPSGTGIAHTFINDSATDVHLLVVGERRAGAGVFYPLHPDTNDKLGERRWSDPPPRPLGPHDGRPRVAAAGERGVVPTLETSRLVLRKLTLDDAEMRRRMRADSEHVRYLLAGRPPTLEEARDRLAWIVADTSRERSKGWAIVRKDTGAAIGQAGIVRIDHEHRRGSLAYEIVREETGQGFAREAVARIVAFGFETMGLHRIQAEIDPDNTRSRRLVEALGFAYEGTLRQSHFHEGRFYDDAIYARLAER